MIVYLLINIVISILWVHFMITPELVKAQKDNVNLKRTFAIILLTILAGIIVWPYLVYKYIKNPLATKKRIARDARDIFIELDKLN